MWEANRFGLVGLGEEIWGSTNHKNLYNMYCFFHVVKNVFSQPKCAYKNNVNLHDWEHQ
jgi:hypothetical protein